MKVQGFHCILNPGDNYRPHHLLPIHNCRNGRYGYPCQAGDIAHRIGTFLRRGTHSTGLMLIGPYEKRNKICVESIIILTASTIDFGLTDKRINSRYGIKSIIVSCLTTCRPDGGFSFQSHPLS